MNLKATYKKFLLTIGKMTFLLVAIISMAFVNNEYKKKKVENITIKIISSNQPMLCSDEEIEIYLKKHFDELKDKTYQDIHFYELENIINEKNEIKTSAIYFTLDNQLYIQITERKPIARILNNRFNHYIDDEWKLFAVTKPYKVPLIMGEIYDLPKLFKHYPINKIKRYSSLSEVSKLDDIYIAMNTILADTLLLNFIDYVYINKNNDIILYPIIGKFSINAGTSEYFQEKMNKLKLFIHQGLNKNDAWNRYSEINLKYKQLIYCTKK